MCVSGILLVSDNHAETNLSEGLPCVLGYVFPCISDMGAYLMFKSLLLALGVWAWLYRLLAGSGRSEQLRWVVTGGSRVMHCTG